MEFPRMKNNECFPNTCIDSGIHLLKNHSHLLLPKLKTRRKKTNIPTVEIITEFLATINYLLILIDLHIYLVGV